MKNFIEKLKKYKVIFGLVILFLGIFIAMLSSNQDRRELNYYKNNNNISDATKYEIEQLCIGEFKPLLVINPFKYWKEQSQCWYKQLKIAGLHNTIKS